MTGSRVRALMLLLAEKVGTAFAFQFAAVLFVGGVGSLYVRQQYGDAVAAGLYSAAVALATGVVTVGLSLKLSGLADAVVRIVLQFVQSFAGSALAGATGDIRHVPWQGALGVAFAATLPTVVKVMAAAKSPNTPGASVIPFRRLGLARTAGTTAAVAA